MDIKIGLNEHETQEQNSKFAEDRVAITLTVKNASSYTANAGGRWAVKDNGTGIAVQANYGQINPGQSETQTVYLASGYETGVFDFAATGADGWFGFHAGDNTTSATLTLGNP